MLRLPVRVVAFAIVCLSAASVRAEASFVGSWDTTFGPMHLFEVEGQLRGFYGSAGQFNSIEGKVDKRRWSFTYREPTVSGAGHFDLAADGATIEGQWREDGATAWQPWQGTRMPRPAKPGKFAGVWDTSFGRMRLLTDGAAVRGCYSTPYGATVDGSVEDRLLKFKYHEPGVDGEGEFRLADDGLAMLGRWRPDSATEWSPWFAERVQPRADRTWLVVVEAHWEQSLAEPEYSFGAMLRSFFARTPQVEVRHRVFDGVGGLIKACHETTYLTEPVVLVIASHGSPQGITVENQVIGAEAFVESLRFADNVELLHFSSCAVMHDRLPHDIAAGRDPAARFPISGYTRSVDWAGSAVLEFLYFDMILSRRQTAAKAAEQVRLLVPFADEKPVAGSLIGPAGFQILLPAETAAGAR